MIVHDRTRLTADSFFMYWNGAIHGLEWRYLLRMGAFLVLLLRTPQALFIGWVNLN